MLAVVIGGSGSGKSEYAENLAVSLDRNRKLYIATMYPWDDESKKRIQRHQRMRAEKQFDTLECYVNWEKGINSYSCDSSEETIHTMFLDCMSNLVANELYCEGGIGKKDNYKEVASYILKGLDAACDRFEHVILVTNDVFTDGVNYDEEMQYYLATLGEINQVLAKRADLVVEVVCGIPQIIKGGVVGEPMVE